MSSQRRTRTKQSKSVRKAAGRIAWLAFFFVLSSTGLIGRVVYFKVVKGEEYDKKVMMRTAGEEYELQPLRGNIVDRNGKNLVISVIAYDVVLDPSVLLQSTEEEIKRAINILAKELSLEVSSIQSILDNYPTSKYKVIKKEISDEIATILRSEKLKGVWLQETFVREYPKETLASQVIGFFNKNGQGQYGVEQQYNDIMTGLTGRVFPKLQEGNIITSEAVSAVDGHTLVLTIDEIIQQYLEEALQKSAKEFKAKNASAIAMNPNTGEILAIAAYPTYNPNQYNDISDQIGGETWDKLTNEEKGKYLNEVWKNYNIHNTYEPGSTFKPIFVAAALEEGVISPDEQFYCTGVKDVAGEKIRCAKRSGHGHINLEEALASSCNVAMMEIAEKLGAQKFIEYQKRFGFGEITGVDLPGEEVGILHSFDQIGPVELATTSFGQTFNITPLQLVDAFAATINGGKLMRPYIVSQIIDEDGNIIKENKPVIRRKVISKEVSDIIRLQSESVVTAGTGKSAAIAGYRVGGKTGTAQKLPREEDKYIYSFIGYAPVENPEIIILTLFDETEIYAEGTGLSARTFKEITEKVLPYLGIESVEGTLGAFEETVTIPDFTNQDIYDIFNSLQSQGLSYEAIGVGRRIKNQYPNPGAILPSGSTIKLYFTSDEPENCIEAPDFMGKTLEEVQSLAKEYQIILEIEGDEGSVAAQVPKPRMKIEKNSKLKVVLKKEI